MFRWLSLVTLISAVAASAYYRRRARVGSETIARGREGSLFLFLRIIMALVLLLPVLCYVANPRWMSWSSFAAPTWIRCMGVLLGVSAVGAVSWVLRSLGENVSETVLTKTDHRLVITGPYRWVRHPLYTTGITLFLAIGLMQASWLVLSAAAGAAVFIALLVIPAEERALVARFGNEYRSYVQRTGMLWPRMSRLSRLPEIE